MLSQLKLHAPPTTLVVAILAWIYGRKVSGATLQETGQLVTAVLAGGFALPTAGAVKNAVAAKVAGTAPAPEPTPAPSPTPPATSAG